MRFLDKALSHTHKSWQPLLKTALKAVKTDYLKSLEDSNNCLPGTEQIFNAFSQPLSNTRYILFGESPYPRKASANGYAFWDAAVNTLWSDTGFSKPVNRATSLRNLLKMLLLTEGLLDAEHTSQAAIAALSKNNLVQTLADLFQNFLKEGFLLLNASLVLSEKPVAYDAKQWLPFMEALLIAIHQHQPAINLILFGKIALTINQLPIAAHFSQLTAEHPYNVSFIHNSTVQAFFKPFNLLQI